MPHLQIDLQGGFRGEPVRVDVEGREVYTRDDVRTDYAAGLADSFGVTVPEGPVTVTLRLSDRGQVGRAVLGEGEERVGFSVEPDGRITHRVLPREVRYL